MDEELSLRTFDLIRDAVLPDFRDRVAEYLVQYETVLLGKPAPDLELEQATANQLRGYLRGLNTTRVLGMADWEELDRRVVNTWLLTIDQ
ncbi:TetR family transcriptional regulator [Pseudomonas sp. IT-P171]